MIQKPFSKKTQYIWCPECKQGAHAVSHLPVGTKTAWYCDDCGAHFRVHVLSLDQVDCEAIPGERKVKRLVTLRSRAPVTLLVEGMTLLPDDDEVHHAQFYYDEHTCPTNYLGRVVEVIDEKGERDPHGVFEFVSIEPWPTR